MTTPYCVIGCTRGTGLQIARQLAERGAPVLGVARDFQVKARNLASGCGPRSAQGMSLTPARSGAARVGSCRAIFFGGGRHRRSWRSRLLQAGKPDPRGDI